MGIFEKLAKVQSELKAPKGQFNKFGNFKFRSCEDVLEAVKPLCIENGLILTLSDTVINVGERYYIEATAKVSDILNDTEYFTKASAREEENKKGMDGSQITGTASSYARKYALNGLFCIDDTKDADTDEHEKQKSKEPVKAPVDTSKMTLEEMSHLKVGFGKYKEKTLKQVFKEDRNYFKWLHDNAKEDQIRIACFKMLESVEKKAQKGEPVYGSSHADQALESQIEQTYQ